MKLNQLTFTSDPFASSSGVDASVHDVMGACFDAITTTSKVRLALYMWHDENQPSGVRNPANLTNSLLDKLSATSDAEVLFDVDYYSTSEASAFKSKLEAGGVSLASFPQHKTPGEGIHGSPKMHDKAMLFSTLSVPTDSAIESLRSETVENVVVLSSANISADAVQPGESANWPGVMS